MAATRPEGVPQDAVDLSEDGGLCKRVLVKGDADGGTPFEGAEVQVHYVGTLLSDGSKFDSSRDRPGNFSFRIGKGSVIKGWDVGVATMHKGEKAELFCRADYAYGEGGSPPKIPGGATLKFEVELLSWAEKGTGGDAVTPMDIGDAGDAGDAIPHAGTGAAGAAVGTTARLRAFAVAAAAVVTEHFAAWWRALLGLPPLTLCRRLFSRARSVLGR